MSDKATNYQCPSCTGPLHYDGAVLDMLHREAQIDSTDYAAEGTIVEAVVDDKTYGRVSTYIMDNE